MNHRILPYRRRIHAVLLVALALTSTVPAGPSRPGAGARPRRPAPQQNTPPAPPPSEWTTQAGPRPDTATATTDAPDEQPVPDQPAPAAEAAVPAPDPLFDDRPTGSFDPVTWMHRPSGQVVSTETYTADACSRLLADETLPPAARASLLGGRARARMRMWRLDAARADIEAALALDQAAAALHLIHAEILACHGRTDDADAALQIAFGLDPASSFNARVLGLLRFQQGSLQAAADALEIHLAHVATEGTGPGDATLPLLHAIAANDTEGLTAVDDPAAPWVAQLASALCGRIDRDTLLGRAREPRAAAPDEAACTAWFYLGRRSLSRGERERATLDLLAAIRTGCTSTPEYRLAVAALINLGALRADSLPGRMAQ